MDVRFHLVDVFADVPLAGNPLAVITDCDHLDVDTMRRIAGELKQAETTFVLRPSAKGADFLLRSFTATGTEVFGAGHNALGAWWLLGATGRLRLEAPRTRFHQQFGERVLPLDVLAEEGAIAAVEMKQEAPVFGRAFSDRAALAAALRVDGNEVDGDAIVVSTGAAHLLVPLRDRAAVTRVRPDAESLLRILQNAGGEGCYVFSLDAVDADAAAHARFFNPTAGITEDSATGTAAGPLAAYLVRTGQAPEGTLIIEQGHAMNRPSRLAVTVRGDDVRLAGRCVVVGEGTLMI